MTQPCSSTTCWLLNFSRLSVLLLWCYSAYEAETKALYDKLLSSNIDHTVVANVAFKIAQQFPIIGMVDTLTSDFLKWVREKRSWQEILPNVKAQRSAKWVASYRTTTLNRPVTNREHPLLMNPFQILIDIMLASIAGKQNL